MSSIYNKHYYEHYDVGVETVDYSNSRYTKDFLEGIANRIADDLAPKTVLDAGCAMGHLVAALRDRGIEAYGVDISEYAVTHVREDIRPYCFQGSLSDPLPEGLPKKFDLVVTIEVLEHLYAEDSRKAIENLCQITDTIIFSSTPDDFEDPTHLNVQQRDYWAALFAQNGFLDDLSYRPTYLTHHAVCYRKRENMLRQIQDYERNIAKTEIAYQHESERWSLVVQDREKQLAEFQSMIEAKDAEIARLEQVHVAELAQKQAEYDQREQEHAAEFAQKQVEYDQREQEHAAELAQKQAEYDQREQEHAAEFAQKQVEYDQREQEHAAELVQQKAIITEAVTMAMEEMRQSDLEKAARRHQEELERREMEKTDEINKLTTQHANEIDATKQQYQDELANLEAELRTKTEHQIKRAKRMIANLQHQHLEEMKSAYDKQNTLLEAKNAELAESNQRCEALQAALDAQTNECKALTERRDYLQLHYVTAMNQREELRIHYEAAMAQKANLQIHYEAAMNQRNELEAQRNTYQAQLAEVTACYQEVLNCTCWKMTKPIRVVGTATKNALKRYRVTRLLYKGCSSLVHEGPSVAWKRVNAYMKKERPINSHILTPEEVETQRKTKFSKNIKFSILVPLYNTPEKFLREMIQSVRDQTYGNWELCMADGSDKEHKYIKQICLEYRAADQRIRYRKLQENLGISGNTNACIEMARGDYIALFDHDDLLHPAALFENMKAICDKGADFIYTDENTFHDTPADAFCPHFKPDYAPDTLRSYNYICHLSVFKRSLLNEVGGFRREFDGSQDYDMVLRLTEKAQCIVHIPQILYYWRSHANSVASDISAKPYTIDAAKKALAEHLRRIGIEGDVDDSSIPSTYHIQYRLTGSDMVSIIIPNKDHIEDLDKCINSIKRKSTYPHWEVIIVENNSTDSATFDFYQKIQEDSRIRVVTWRGIFNYSAINNFGVQYARGKYLLLLNNDVEVITPDWLEQMLMYAQREDVGAVGSMLYYPDNTVQHAGVILGIGGVAGHAHKYFKRGDYGYMSRMTIAQNLSAVTAACLMTRKDVWQKIQGLDEGFQVAFNDVDLCMRIRQAGYLIVWTPYAELYHYESKSRGIEDTPEKQTRFAREIQRFQTRWKNELEAGDPYYNPNLTLAREDFSIKS